MQRVAFRLRVRRERIEDYDQAHRQVWPELLAVLTAAGVSEYSIFRRGQELFFYMRIADDFASTWERIERSPVNKRWQKKMAPLFEPVEPVASGERFPMLQEVFYLQ